MELPGRRRHILRNILSLGIGAQVLAIGGLGTLDFAHLAKRARKFVEGKGVALVQNLLRPGPSRSRFCGVDVSRRSLEDCPRWSRMVLFLAQYGRKIGHSCYRH